MAAIQTSESVSLSALESHLWESANILRGPVDASDFKSFIFPLLFFKRVSDVYDEEYQNALAASSGDIAYAQFAENHRFQIPQGCHWNDVRATTANVGQGIQRSMREIEKANPNTLYGIFGDTPWGNKDRLSDALLRDLIEHFSKISLANKDIGDNVLGQAYGYLIKKFADQTNRKAGEFYTPRTVIRLMIDILDPKAGETIYDPACGTAGMLLLEEDHIQKVLEAFQAFKDIPEFARAVPVDEIKANQSSLNLALYVRSKGNGQGATAASTKPLSQVIQKWQESSKALRSSMNSLLQELTTSAPRGKLKIIHPKG